MNTLLAAVFVICVAATASGSPPSVKSADQLAARIDGFLESHWSTNKIVPADQADDATFLRRITLDLTGRIPTVAELDRFLADKSKDKRRKLIEQLVNGPEFPLHFGNILDEMIQGRFSGNDAFIDYLRRSLREGKSWDVLFRELMLGPWDTDEMKPANRFLDKRARNLESLTSDATRVFFGVNISCAKCHDHPLVADWTQDHFYGMVSFFNRTTGGKGKVGEKSEGVVTFPGPDGKEKTAAIMFLSGRVIEETASTDSDKKKFSRRGQLVTAALEDRVFFGRSFVNRMWQWFFGLGLVEPVDQMHSENPSAVPGLLESVSEDFIVSGYDTKRLITALVSTRVYGLSSRWRADSKIPEPESFAVARLRPLNRRQLTFSLLLATGEGSYDAADPVKARVANYLGVSGLNRIEQYLRIEGQAKILGNSLDPRTPDFQSSTAEALFMSNNEAVQQLVRSSGGNLAGRLAGLTDTRTTIETAVKRVLTRRANEEETKSLVDWFDRHDKDRRKTCEQLIWALVTSAEFRFNH